MSKLDRQLDEISGESKVYLSCLRGETIDINAIRSLLRQEIDGHRQRIPLDLRGVHGAPPELVTLIHEAQRYAEFQEKVLSISSMLSPMQAALGIQRDAVTQEKQTLTAGRGESEPYSEHDAGKHAENALKLSHSIRSDAQQISSKAQKPFAKSKAAGSKNPGSKNPGSKNRTRNLIQLIAILVVGLAIVGVVEYHFVFQQSTPVIVPIKIYETQQQK